jgi:6-phosphogluconolactonase
VSVRARIVVTDEPAAEAAGLLAAVAGRGGHVALSGGSTPRAAYARAAAAGVDWSRATLWLGDERCVPPDHDQSNFGMVKAALLDRIDGAPPDVRRIEGERPAHEAASLYERALRDAFGGGVPELDLALMGLGPDAHTASLFPRDAALGVRDRLVIAVERPGMAPIVPRVTLTLPVFNAAREVVFLAAGEDKAAASRRAFEGPGEPDAPASLVRPRSGSLTALLDPAAAGELGGAAGDGEAA